MRIAFAKHRLLADFRSALLCVLTVTSLVLAFAAAAARAETGGATAVEAAAPSGQTPSVSGPGTSGAAATGKPTLATWFGPGFYGQTTACGQTMSPALVGVASRTLPCGTLVQVAYRGRQLTVPVLDRGPYGHNRATWDLTAGAARALGIKETVRIRTEVVGSLPNEPMLGQPAEAPTAAATAASTASTGGAAAS